MFEYSIIIRTTGKAGEKYKCLLKSIENLNQKPKEVIVVLPNGYDLPDDKLGYETFCFCTKGMVRQRLYGIEKCKTKYALITDDDISFDSDFIDKLSKPVLNLEYGCSAGPLLNFFPRKGFNTFIAMLMGNAVPTIFHKKRYVTLLNTTGYSYNRKLKFNESRLYETQAAAWTCFFADIDKLRSIHLEDEIWLDKYGYASYDDTTMFYKLWINNIKSVIVSDALYKHLDAKTSTKNVNTGYSFGFNFIVFANRFLYQEKIGIKKIWVKICVNYRAIMNILFYLYKLLRGKTSKNEIRDYIKGINDAKLWVKSEEYKGIHSVKYDI